jgi:hypothetical protein
VEEVTTIFGMFMGDGELELTDATRSYETLPQKRGGTIQPQKKLLKPEDLNQTHIKPAKGVLLTEYDLKTKPAEVGKITVEYTLGKSYKGGQYAAYANNSKT